MHVAASLSVFALLAAAAARQPAARADDPVPGVGDAAATAARVVASVNAFRKTAGLGPVTFEPRLSKGCEAHAKYLVTNRGQPSVQGLGAHEETPSLPGYSEEGARAGKSSDIAFTDPVSAVDGWMATLYHRTPILDFGLTQVGIGAARDPEGGWISVMDVTEGKGGGKRPAGRGPAVVIYPVDKQKDVPVAFGGEVPNPVPEAKDGAGYPVTAQFPSGVPVKAARAVLKDAEGKPLDGWVSSPESPADARFQRGTVCVFAKQAFAPGATYTVEMTAKVGGAPWKRTWTFSTKAADPAAEAK